MPVLVIGGASPLGRALCEALIETGGQVRAYLAVDDADLRAAGVHVAIGPPIEVQKLESALTQVHTLVHLTGAGVRAARDEAEALEVTAIAAHAASIPRVVVLTPADRRAARGVSAGLEHLKGRDFETVLVPATDDPAGTVQSLLAADARE